MSVPVALSFTFATQSQKNPVKQAQICKQQTASAVSNFGKVLQRLDHTPCHTLHCEQSKLSCNQMAVTNYLHRDC